VSTGAEGKVCPLPKQYPYEALDLAAGFPEVPGVVDHVIGGAGFSLRIHLRAEPGLGLGP